MAVGGSVGEQSITQPQALDNDLDKMLAKPPVVSPPVQFAPQETPTAPTAAPAAPTEPSPFVPPAQVPMAPAAEAELEDTSLDSMLATPPTKGASQQVPQPSTSPYDSMLAQPELASQHQPSRDLGTLFTGGARRNWQQMLAASPTWRAIYAEMQGDLAGRDAAMAEALALEQAGGDTQWQLQNVESFSDFGYWLTEKFGENALTMLAAAGTGGVGAILGRGIATGLGFSTAAARQALLRGGVAESSAILAARQAAINRTAGTLLVGGATYLETPGTAQEQYQVSGSTNPALSLSGGLAKGLLEAYTPMRILNALTRPGRQLGASVVGGAVSTGLREGVTEFTQEAIDIGLRRYTDPNYQFFGQGPFYMGEGAWRLAEATVAGTALGTVMGGAGALAERRQERSNEPAPGSMTVIPPAEAPPIGGSVPPQLPPGGPQGAPGGASVDGMLVGGPSALGAQPGTVGPVSAAAEGALQGVDVSTADAVEQASVRIQTRPREGEVPQEQTNRVNAIRQSMPEDVTFETTQTDETGQTEVVIRRGGREVGNLYVRSINQSGTSTPLVLQMEIARIDEAHRRLGIGTGIQERLEQQFGAPFAPTDTLSNAAYQRWLQLDPEAVAKHQRVSPAENTGWVLSEAPNYNTPRMQRVRAALASQTYSQEVSRGAGPVTTVRNMVLPKASPDVNLEQATPHNPREDLLGAIPLLRTVPETQRELMLDMLEANTERYVVDTGTGALPVLYNSTDLETKLAVYHQPSEAHTVYRVDQTSLQPIGISAHVYDLPEVTSNRIFFQKGTTQQEQQRLHQQYAVLWTKMVALREQGLLNAQEYSKYTVELVKDYDQLLTDGLRVVPSRGSSFYYNLGLERREEVKQPAKTLRSRQIAFLNPNGVLELPITGQTEDTLLRDPSDTGFTNTIPISVDLNKFAPGEIASVPQVFPSGLGFTGSVEFKAGLSEGQQAALFNELAELAREELAKSTTELAVVPGWTREGLNKYKALMRKGVWIAPDSGSSALVTRSVIKPEQYTFGINHHHIDRITQGRSDSTQTTSQTNNKTWWKLDASVGTRVVSLTLQDTLAQKVEAAAKKYASVVDNILASVGIEGRPIVNVVDFNVTNINGSSSSHALLNEGAIFLLPHSIVQLGSAEHIEMQTFTTLMHELGHLIFYHFYNTKMDSEQHQMLRSAYHKALLLGRVNPSAAAANISAIGRPGQVIEPLEYYLTYPEWLAEQFDRWVRGKGRGELKTELETYYKELADAMDRYYAEWEKLSGPKILASIAEPDHYFSMFMEYLLTYGQETKSRVKAYLQQQMLHAVPTDLLENPSLVRSLEQAQLALKSMEQMLPGDAVKLLFGEKLDPGLAKVDPSGVARAVRTKNAIILEFIIGAMQTKNEYAEYRTRIAHEFIHAYSMMNLITPQELEILYQSATREGKKIDAGSIASVSAEVNEAATIFGWDAQETKRQYDLAIREETAAQYVESVANGAVASGETQTIVARILAIIERIRNFMADLGYQTRDDVIRAIFRGEVAAREHRIENSEIMEGLVKYAISPDVYGTEAFDEVKQLSANIWVGAKYTGKVGENKNTSQAIGYYFFNQNPTGNTFLPPISYMLLANRGRKGFEVEFTESDAFMMLDTMKRYTEQDLGRPLWPSGVFSEVAYRIAKRAYPEQLKYYVPMRYQRGDKVETWYWSPVTIRSAIKTWTNVLEKNRRATTQREMRAFNSAQRELARLKQAEARIDPKIWTKDKNLLNQMFSIDKNLKHDGVKGSMYAQGLRTEEAQVMNMMGISESPEAKVDPYLLQEQERARFLQSEAAKKLGIEFDQAAPPQMEVRYMRRLMDRLQGQGVFRGDVRRELAPEVLREEADRIGKFSKQWWSLKQLLGRNTHIEGLRRYDEAVEAFVRTVSGWHADTGDIAKQWLLDIPTLERREVFAQTLFWLTEQTYNQSIGGNNPINRHPTKAELDAKLALENFTPKERALLAKIYVHPFDLQQGAEQSIFGKFLDDVEQVSLSNIMRTVSTPQQQALAIGELNIEMNKLREKPYFPLSRFGQYTLTVREPNQNQTGTVTVWHSAYDQYHQLETAVLELRQQFPHGEIRIGRVPEEMIEFMGLPAPLIKLIRTQMPGLTAQQQVWLEDFERNNTPDRTFRKRWLPQSGLQGHSMDAHRAFSHYFMNGGRYLARLTHNHEMTSAIESVRSTLRTLSNNAKRTQILDFMVSHHKYITEPGRDFAKLKAFIGVWQLGYSPAAALMNLTQIPTVTNAYLAGIFGTGQGNAQIFKSMRAAKNIRTTGTPTSGKGGYEAARLEAIEAGRIDIGLASELGAYSESSNLKALLAGTKAQKWMQNVPYYGMWMFQKAEQINREVTFHAAWELAKSNPTHAKLQEIDRYYNNALTDLEVRLSTPTRRFTREDAIAYWFAKQAIDETQGIYAPHGRPRFLRNPYGNVVLIFFQYVQLMTYVFRYNPGVVQLSLVYLALYGMMGLPGAEDLNEVLKAIGQRLFGKDWDVFKVARKYARDLTKGTLFDETGPDLLLHGMSRYSFGLGLLPEGYGAPRFDASSNGSLGKIVPGLYEAAHGLATRQDYDQYITDIVQRLAGAGYGYTFNLTRWGMEGSGSVDSHTWERALPRSARSIVRAYRFAPPETGLPTLGPLAPRGAETTRSGARIVRFNVNDPDDMASVITQALGFSPTRVNETWEMLREQRDTFQVLKARRTALYAQFDYALQSGRPDLRNDVLQGIRDFNEDIRAEMPSMMIQPAQLQQSLRNRTRARALQENLLPTQRSQIPVARSIQDQYPGVRSERVR